MDSSLFDKLDKKAKEICEPALDNPEDRYKLREDYYLKFGFSDTSPYGYGTSELAFIRWEIDRGVLNPMNAIAKPGSAWWRNVNYQFLYHGTLAELLFENNIKPEEVGHPSASWLKYMLEPSSQNWYKAHNTSISVGYFESNTLAEHESGTEVIFIKQVLMRLYFAQAMVMGESYAFGKLGELFANPDDNSVTMMVHIPDFYPDDYPLSKDDILRIEYKELSFVDWVARIFDEDVIGPHITELFSAVANWLMIPEITELVFENAVNYPFPVKSTEEISLNILVPRDPVVPANKTKPNATSENIMTAKQKIIVLGGGPSALAATYELTDYAGWEDKFDITLFQVGWRLGGKTATGRGVHNRVEERGIHIFQGWYDNGFRLIQDAYRIQQEKGLAPDSPFKSWQDALVPDYSTLMTEFVGEEGGWRNWPVVFPANDKVPGAGIEPTFSDVLKELISMCLEMLLGSAYEVKEPPFPGPPAHDKENEKPGFFGNIFHKIEQDVKGFIKRESLKFLPEAHELAQNLVEADHEEKIRKLTEIGELIRKFRNWFSSEINSFLYQHDTIRRIIVMLEWMEINLVGMLADVYDPYQQIFDFKRINQYDYCDWLRKHGASEMLLNSGPVRFMYYGSFANLKDQDRGTIAADLALRMLMLSISYKESLVWKMKGGTADTLVTPIFHVLRDRGVDFKFFHKIKKIHYSANGEIEEITVGKQVTLKDENVPYQPTMRANGLDAWPSHPLYDQIQDDQAVELQKNNIDLESSWAPWVEVETIILKKGIDFDQIILGIPAAALKDICSEIVDKDQRWRDMVEQVKMVPTFGICLWIKKTQAEMGFEYEKWGIEAGMEPNTVVYANPLYSWTSMDLILAQEDWKPDNMPKQLSYFCGTYDIPTKVPPFSDHGYPEREMARLMGITEQWLHDYMGWFWPKAIPGGYEKGFDLNLLIDPDGPNEPSSGIDKLQKQFFSLNIEPSNQYCLARPGTDKYRFKANETGFSNLFVCGDWTNFGLNVGHMEGAFVSGIRAAQAILPSYGFTDLKKIMGSAEQMEV